MAFLWPRGGNKFNWSDIHAIKTFFLHKYFIITCHSEYMSFWTCVIPNICHIYSSYLHRLAFIPRARKLTTRGCHICKCKSRLHFEFVFIPVIWIRDTVKPNLWRELRWAFPNCLKNVVCLILPIFTLDLVQDKNINLLCWNWTGLVWWCLKIK